jgi:hypothetical protein
VAPGGADFELEVVGQQAVASLAVRKFALVLASLEQRMTLWVEHMTL